MKHLWPWIVKTLWMTIFFSEGMKHQRQGEQKSVHKKNWERERKTFHCVHRRERFLKILKVYSGDSDRYYCTVNRGMDAGRLSKERVQGSRYAGYPLGGVSGGCSSCVRIFSTQCVPCLQVASFILLLNSVFVNQKERREVVLNHWCKVAL